MTVRITGLRETQAELQAMSMTLIPKLVPVVKGVTRDGVIVAKAGAEFQNDTGALKDSIHSKVMKIAPTVVEIDVIAGNPTIIRGAGKYTYSTYMKKQVTNPTPTTEYADKIDAGFGTQRGQGAKGYMSVQAYGWMLKTLPTRIRTMLLRVMR